MANYNKVFLMGNLTRDPELRYLQNGRAVANIGMAINRKYRNKNTQEMVEETTFVDLEAWGQQAETICRYMTKGQPMFVEGRLKLDSWEDRDGQKRSRMRVVIENFQFLSGGGRGGSGQGGERPRPVKQPEAGQVSEPGPQEPAEDYNFDDIPF
jgi:single-strand DNA-binding protein